MIFYWSCLLCLGSSLDPVEISRVSDARRGSGFFDDTPLFRQVSIEERVAKYNEYVQWRFPNQNIPLELELVSAKEQKGELRIKAKQAIKKSDLVLKAPWESMIRDDICQEHLFTNRSTKCRKLIMSLNLEGSGEALAFGAVYHMFHPENSK